MSIDSSICIYWLLPILLKSVLADSDIFLSPAMQDTNVDGNGHVNHTEPHRLAADRQQRRRASLFSIARPTVSALAVPPCLYTSITAEPNAVVNTANIFSLQRELCDSPVAFAAVVLSAGR